MNWLSNNNVVLSNIASIATLLGIGISLWALWLTYLQAKSAFEAAERASEAVDNFRFRWSTYDGLRDLSEATYALKSAKKHIANDSWHDASECYEDARQALLRIITAPIGINQDEIFQIKRACKQFEAFCKKIDLAIMSGGELPDKASVLTTHRSNYEILVRFERSLQSRIS